MNPSFTIRRFFASSSLVASAVVLALFTLCSGPFAPTASALTQINVYEFLNYSLAPTGGDANVTSSNIDFNSSAASQADDVSNTLDVNDPSSATTEATAVSNNSFFEFTVTPKAGYEMNLITLAFIATTSRLGGGCGVRSSIGSFGSDLYTSEVYATDTIITVDLPSSKFQNLTTATTFRIYSYEPSGSGAYETFQGLGLSGSATAFPVPEPSTLATVLGGIGMLGFVSRRPLGLAERSGPK